MSGPIRERLASIAAEEGGFLPFERFMREALYNPNFGYYARNARDVGRKGDFSTSATLHPALGRAVGIWARGCGGELRDWIEVGAGSGDLAANLLDSLGWRGRRRIRYRIVELSPRLRAVQERRLKGYRVIWHDSVGEALAAAEGEAVIFSNELVDAFPCVRLEWDGMKWMELGLAVDARRSVEALREPGPRVVAQLPQAWSGIGKGQRCEVHVAYREWFGEWVPNLRGGSLLTIDYGGEFPEVHRRSPKGTVRAYFRQERYEGNDIYQRVGAQDLTCDVNFSDLRRWGTELGLRERECVSQREFLLKWGGAAEDSDEPVLRFLTDVSGAGHAFRMLWQERA